MAQIIGCLQKNKLSLIFLTISPTMLIVVALLYIALRGMSTRKLSTHCSYDGDIFPEEKIFVNDGTKFGFRQFPGDDDEEKVEVHTTEFRESRETNEFIERDVESSIHIDASEEDNLKMQQGVDEVKEGNEVIGLNDPLVSNQGNQNDCVVLTSDGDSCASYQGVDKVEEGDEVDEPVISLGCGQESHNDSIVLEENECGTLSLQMTM
ncbi:hypothetical protein THOM_0381 [Trachipleistophora hominis]|uniref:Transmembrane protein n=1 Tax=Trachipleistophora hominis TaxID=72359 RepID=L7K0F9_TRAHO|nr:hypothetical protein THOM_0381 [Trachipleistophora hominis]